MTTHNILVSPAECGECKRLLATPPHEWRMDANVSYMHLQAQKDALWEAAVAAFGPEPIEAIVEHVPCNKQCIGWDLRNALRAQMEAKK